MKKILFAAVCAALCLVSCTTNNWTSTESELINNPNPVMRVLTVDSPEDFAVLRATSSDFTIPMLKSSNFDILAQKMLITVQHPSQDGVGIAGPQVGINRRIVAVQRFDKEGEPFEVYPNIRIVAMRGDSVSGAEGCLSVPGFRGDVCRYRDIDITYTSLNSFRDTTETVQGFTAVIFQHECDHLDGVIYTDKAENLRSRE